jgi:hypothetical protein
MSKRSTRLFAATAVFSVAAALLNPISAYAAVPAPATTTNSAAGAAGWLARQLENSAGTASNTGDHLNYVGFPGFDGGTTADVVFALTAAKVGRNKVNAVLSYYAKHVNDYTSVSDTTGAPGPYAGSLAKAALAAIIGGANPTKFGGYNLIRALKTSECSSVSAPTSNSDFTTPTCPAVGAGRNIFSSVAESFVVLAEARSGGVTTAGLKYFLSLQCADGGFTVATTGGSSCRSDLDSTSYAVSALLAVKGHSLEVNRAVSYLIAHRAKNSAWYSDGKANVDSTGLAASALAATGHNVVASQKWLASQQVLTGTTIGTGSARGALKYNGAFGTSSVKATADGLLGLANKASLASLTQVGSTGTSPVLAPAGVASIRPAGRGGIAKVTAIGFSKSETITITITSPTVALRVAKATANGNVALSFALPAGLKKGKHTAKLTGRTSGLSLTFTFTTV